VARDRATHRLRTADRLERDALRRQVAPEPPRERLDRDPVARALDQDDGAR
jgi:hypothetical protein